MTRAATTKRVRRLHHALRSHTHCTRLLTCARPRHRRDPANEAPCATTIATRGHGRRPSTVSLHAEESRAARRRSLLLVSRMHRASLPLFARRSACPRHACCEGCPRFALKVRSSFFIGFPLSKGVISMHLIPARAGEAPYQKCFSCKMYSRLYVQIEDMEFT